MGTILGFSAILKNFRFFWKFSKTRPSMAHWAKKISKNVAQNMFKSGLDTFGKDFGHFCNFKKFLIFLRIFEDSTHQGTLGKKIFRNNYPETCSKHVWTVMGTILGLFGILENFWFFWKFSKTRPSMEHWAKKFFEKIAQNMFKTRLDSFGNDCGQFWNFESFLIFWKFSKTRPSIEHWAKKLSKKLPQNMFKTRLDFFGNDFRLFCNFEKFSIFFENFRRLDPPWHTGQKKFRKV